MTAKKTPISFQGGEVWEPKRPGSKARTRIVSEVRADGKIVRWRDGVSTGEASFNRFRAWCTTHQAKLRNKLDVAFKDRFGMPPPVIKTEQVKLSDKQLAALKWLTKSKRPRKWVRDAGLPSAQSLIALVNSGLAYRMANERERLYTITLLGSIVLHKLRYPKQPDAPAPKPSKGPKATWWQDPSAPDARGYERAKLTKSAKPPKAMVEMLERSNKEIADRLAETGKVTRARA